MAQRKKSRGHRHSGAAAGLSGAATHPTCCTASRLVLTPPATARLGPSPRAAAQLHLRAADRAADAPGGGHADVRQGRRRARRPVRAGDPLGHPVDRGAVGDPAAVLRAGALPRPHPDDPGRADAPRPVPLRLLRRQGRHRRPRGAPQPRRRPHLGELRGRAARRATTARPTSCSPNSAGHCARRRRRPKGSTGDCCPRSRNSIPAWMRYLGEGAA